MIVTELRKIGIPTFVNHINQRVAYQSMFTYQLDLEELDPTLVNGLEAAKRNAENISLELIAVLKSNTIQEG